MNTLTALDRATRTTIGVLSCAASPDTLAPCPLCRRGAALIALGVRRDHPHRLRPWIARPTLLALCRHCEAVVEQAAPERAALDNAPAPRGRAIAFALAG